MVGQRLHQGPEVDGPFRVTGHREDTLDDPVEKAQPLRAHLLHDLPPDVLGVHVADPGAVLGQHQRRIAATEEAVPTVEQKMCRRPGRGHQGVDFFRCLDDGPHVRMVDQLDPFALQVLSEGLKLFTEIHQLLRRQSGPFGQRLRAIAVDRVRALGGDQDLAAIVLQPRDEGLCLGDFVLDGMDQQVSGIPAGDENQIMLRHKGTQFFRIVRPAVAAFHPVKADDLACLVQDLLRRDVGADCLIVVVRPGDGVCTVADHVRTCSFDFSSQVARAA